MCGWAEEGLPVLDMRAEAGQRAADVHGAIVVDVSLAHNEVLDGRHKRVEAEGLPVMKVNAEQPCRPACDANSRSGSSMSRAA